MTLEESYQRCLNLTREHYENFPVARLVPKKIRPFISAVYAFARTADDIADENWDTPDGPSIEERLAHLNAYEVEFMRAVEGKSIVGSQWQWIFLATADTIKKMDLPVQLFKDLLSAFKQDVTTLRYETFEAVLDYCRRSANPVGRLVLLLHGYQDEDRFAWSDQICTALQLANFWQDISVDIKKGRIYIPQEDWKRFGVNESLFSREIATEAMKRCIKHQVDRTYRLFEEGRMLSRHLKFPLSLEIRLTWLGGQAILDKIIELDYDTVQQRPKINKKDKATLLLKAFFTQ